MLTMIIYFFHTIYELISMQVAAMEAVDAGQKKIAHQALLLLLNMLIYEESVAAVLPPGFEATLHCNIIKLTQKVCIGLRLGFYLHLFYTDFYIFRNG